MKKKIFFTLIFSGILSLALLFFVSNNALAQGPIWTCDNDLDCYERGLGDCQNNGLISGVKCCLEPGGCGAVPYGRCISAPSYQFCEPACCDDHCSEMGNYVGQCSDPSFSPQICNCIAAERWCGRGFDPSTGICTDEYFCDINYADESDCATYWPDCGCILESNIPTYPPGYIGDIGDNGDNGGTGDVTIGGGGVFEIRNPLEAESFEQLIGAISNFIFWIGMAIAPVMFIVAGFFFVTSAGDPKKVQTAKGVALYTIIGLVVILLASGLIKVLESILGAT